MPKKSCLPLHPSLVALADLMTLHVAVVTVFWMQSGGDDLLTAGRAYLPSVPAVSLLALLLLPRCGLYGLWLDRGRSHFVFGVAMAALVMAGAEATLPVWQHRAAFSPGLAGAFAVAQFVLLAAWRMLLYELHWRLRPPVRVMVIAASDIEAIALARRIEGAIPGRTQVAGCLSIDDSNAGADSGLHETLQTLERNREGWDLLALAPRLEGAPSLAALATRLGKRTLAAPGPFEMALQGARAVEIGDGLFFELREPRLSAGEVLAKRVFDVVAASALLLLLAPLMLVIAAAVRASSRGRAIFSQDRQGKDGREFAMRKFRSMVADAERLTGPVLAQEADSRITPLGRILRASRIDELPQLINVLCGEMSLVGPRPEREFFAAGFRRSVPGYDLRLGVRPGISGLAQVAGSYATPVERKLPFDLLYLYGYSLRLDFNILLRTCLVVLRRERAEGLNVTAVADVAAVDKC